MKHIIIKEGNVVNGLGTYANRIEVCERDYGAHVDLWYPSRDKPAPRVTIELNDIRAANSIAIEYDFERDGYVVRMDKTINLGSIMDVVEKNVEVAFIPAWLEIGVNDE